MSSMYIKMAVMPQMTPSTMFLISFSRLFCADSFFRPAFADLDVMSSCEALNRVLDGAILRMKFSMRCPRGEGDGSYPMLSLKATNLSAVLVLNLRVIMRGIGLDNLRMWLSSEALSFSMLSAHSGVAASPGADELNFCAVSFLLGVSNWLTLTLSFRDLGVRLVLEDDPKPACFLFCA